MLQNCAADYSISYAMMQRLALGVTLYNLILVKLSIRKGGGLMPLFHTSFLIVIRVQKEPQFDFIL